MDFTLSPEIEQYRQRVRAFVDEHVLPVESDPDSMGEGEYIRPERLATIRERARALVDRLSPRNLGGPRY